MHKAIIWLTCFFSVHRPSHPKAFRFNEYCIMSQAIMMRNVLGVCSGSLITGFVSPIQTASASLFTNWLKWMQLRRNENSFDATQKWNQVCVVSVFSLIREKWMTCKGKVVIFGAVLLKKWVQAREVAWQHLWCDVVAKSSPPLLNKRDCNPTMHFQCGEKKAFFLFLSVFVFL